MYLYVGFFNEDEVGSGRKYISEKSVSIIKKAFSNYLDLNGENVKAAIGYFVGKANSQEPCFLMDIDSIKATEKNIVINFNKGKELPKNSGEIKAEIYKKSWQLDWMDRETRYFPLLLMLDKNTFDSIRKGSANIKKLLDMGEKVQDLISKNEWEEICKLYEPLEDIPNNSDLWNNPEELYKIGYACSKVGELQNGLEKDRDHLKKIRRYRELSLKFYERCYELNPKNHKYPSALAYRYYQNVNELTKSRGKRRDGNVREEIKNAHKWFDISLNLDPDSVKDNYRKGKMIIDKQIEAIMYSGKRLTREDFQEIDNLKEEAIESLTRAIQSYEGLTDEDAKKRCKNEYIKSLYNLGKFYRDEVDINWNEFICSKIGDRSYTARFYKLDYLIKARRLLEKCYKEVTGLQRDDQIDIKALAKINRKESISPVDSLYSLGVLYFNMYFIKFVINNKKDIERYSSYAYKFLKGAIELSNEIRKKRRYRNTDYMNNYLAYLYIIDGKYTEAIKNTKRCRAHYIKNTYATALMLTKAEDNIREAIKTLRPMVKDRYNKSINLSIVLLAKAYQLMGYEEEKLKLINDNKNGTVDKLLELIM